MPKPTPLENIPKSQSQQQFILEKKLKIVYLFAPVTMMIGEGAVDMTDR